MFSMPFPQVMALIFCFLMQQNKKFKYLKKQDIYGDLK